MNEPLNETPDTVLADYTRGVIERLQQRVVALERQLDAMRRLANRLTWRYSQGLHSFYCVHCGRPAPTHRFGCVACDVECSGDIEVAQAELAASQAREEALRVALPPAPKLKMLAAWLDIHDDEFGGKCRDVQLDLRLWADKIETALAADPGQAAVARLREALELCRVRLASIRSACEDWRGGVNSEALRDAMRYVPESLAKADAALAADPGQAAKRVRLEQAVIVAARAMCQHHDVQFDWFCRCPDSERAKALVRAVAELDTEIILTTPGKGEEVVR